MDPQARPVGRRAFLGLVRGGVGASAGAARASRVLSPLTSGFAQLGANLLPLGGWRIYTITGVMPDLDAAQWRLRIDGPGEGALAVSLAAAQAGAPAHRGRVRAAADVLARAAAGAAARRADLDVPLRDGLDGQGRALVGDP